MKLLAKIRAIWQDVNKELAESAEKKKLRETVEGLQQHNAALMEQVRVMTQLLQNRSAQKDQEKAIKGIYDLLEEARKMRDTEYWKQKSSKAAEEGAAYHKYVGDMLTGKVAGPYYQTVVNNMVAPYVLTTESEADGALRTVCEKVLHGVRPEGQEEAYLYISGKVKERCSGFEWEEWKFADFMAYAKGTVEFVLDDGTVYNVTPPADETRPKLFVNIPAMKISINSVLAGIEIDNPENANELLKKVTDSFLGSQNKFTDKLITDSQRREVRKHIRDSIQARCRFTGIWNPPLHPYDTVPGLNGLEITHIALDEADLLPIVNYGGPHGFIPISAKCEVPIPPLPVKSEKDEREAPCEQCESGQYKLISTDPSGTQRYECEVCGDRVSFP